MKPFTPGGPNGTLRENAHGLYMICDITIVSRPQQGSHFVQGLVSPISLFV